MNSDTVISYIDRLLEKLEFIDKEHKQVTASLLSYKQKLLEPDSLDEEETIKITKILEDLL